MIQNELELSKTQKDITPDVSLITNLQNMKYALLADYDDKRIFTDMLLKMEVTDQLIEEHLDASKRNANKKHQSYLPRDPACYREY